MGMLRYALGGLLVLIVVSRFGSCSSPPVAPSDPDAVPKYLAAQAAARAASEAAAREAAISPAERKQIEADRLAAEAKQQARDAAIEKASQGLKAVKWWEACARWGREARRNTIAPTTVALERHLRQEGILNDRDANHVYSRDKMPAVGMSGCGARAILGVPEDHNVTTGASYTHVQMVYSSRGIYVYTEGPSGDHNGVVRSVQY